jgi:rubrerythrin
MSMQQPQKSEGAIISGKDLIDAIRLGGELKAQQSASQPQQDPMAVYRMVTEIVKPFQDSAAQHQRELSELRLKEAESKVVDPIAYVKNMKSIAADLGLTSNGTANEFTLKKAEMDQTKELENKKLEWEMRKWELEKEKEGNTLETVKNILEGPAGEILKSFGSAGAERLRGGNKASASNGNASQSQLVKVKCPNCSGDFPANPQLPMIQCPICGVQLQNGNQSPANPQEPQNHESSNPTQEQPKTESVQIQPAQNLQQEKPVDQTVEAESPVEQISTK